MYEGSSSQMYRDSLLEIYNNFKTKNASRGGEYAVNLKDIESYFIKMKSKYYNTKMIGKISLAISSRTRSEDYLNTKKS